MYLVPSGKIEIFYLVDVHIGFSPDQNEVSFLKIRLKEEKDKVERTNQAKAELEARCQRAERERDMYRLLARRWQSRLQAVLDEQRNGLSASSNTAGATAAALQELQQEALGILNDSSDDDSEEDEEDQEDDVSMMEQDEYEEADENSDGLGHAAAAPVHAPGNGRLQDDEAYFSCVEHAAPSHAQPIHGSSSTMDEEMSDVEEGDLGTAQVTGTDNLEIVSESKVRAVSIASDDL